MYVNYGYCQPFPSLVGSNSVSVVESAVLELGIIIDNKSIASRKLVEEAQPWNVFRLVNENYHFVKYSSGKRL